MYQITELPAWDSKGEPKLLSTKCTSVRLFEEKERRSTVNQNRSPSLDKGNLTKDQIRTQPWKVGEAIICASIKDSVFAL